MNSQASQATAANPVDVRVSLEPDPLKSLCICGFRSECGPDTTFEHFLKTDTIRASNYDTTCRLVYNTNPCRLNACAVDHIIELEQVKNGMPV